MLAGLRCVARCDIVRSGEGEEGGWQMLWSKEGGSAKLDCFRVHDLKRE